MTGNGEMRPAPGERCVRTVLDGFACLLLGGVEQGEQDAAEGGFTAGGVVPLGEGVDAAAGAAGGECDGGDAKGEGQVGVG